jgi:hypothetical protein
MREITTEVKINDITLEVFGTYFPAEGMVMYDNNMEGYPGCPAEFELNTVSLEGIVITTLLDGDIIDEIIEKVIENQEN